MLTLRTSLDDCSSIRHDPTDLPETTFLEIFDHPIIERSSRKLENGIEIWVGEGADPLGGVANRHARTEETRRFDGFDGIRLSFTNDEGEPRLIVARSIGGTSPMYVSRRASGVTLSWKFEEAVSRIASPLPNRDVCRLVLAHGVGQTREQIIDGVFALWPGEKVVFDRDGLDFSVCEDIRVSLPNSLSDRARATDAFIEVISSVIRPALLGAVRPLLEYSGGMDSTCVALAARSCRHGLESYGLIQPGPVGLQQSGRREELIELLGLTDYTGSSAAVLPLDTLLAAECTITPYDDCYRLSIMQALETHDLSSVDLVISGLGGDELAKDNTFWRYDWEVPGYTSRSAIVSSVSNFDLFMRKGIWPLNPLSHPKVVNFCRSLPDSLRKGRLFNRLAIARSGLSDGYLAPRYHETFANVLLLQAINCDVSSFLDESILGDFALLDTSKLLSEFYEETELGISIKMVGKLYQTCKLEVLLRRYVS